MSSFPARRMGLFDRGLLRTGMFADVVICSPKNIMDVATYNNPHQYAKGIKYVFVNGKITIKNGKPTSKRSEKALRYNNIM